MPRWTLGGESKSAATYKDYVLDRVCRVKWRPDTAILMASMFRDLTLTDEQLGWAVVKLTKYAVVWPLLMQKALTQIAISAGSWDG